MHICENCIDFSHGSLSRLILFISGAIKNPEANPDAKRLYDDLLSNYNRLIRPVINNTETLTVWVGLKITQLIEVNLKNQVMTTNLWVPQVRRMFKWFHSELKIYCHWNCLQKWYDYKLRWDPEEYGGVEQLYMPSEHIWLPDIVLYNNWDGNYEVSFEKFGDNVLFMF